jgi:hypothetical protein
MVPEFTRANPAVSRRKPVLFGGGQRTERCRTWRAVDAACCAADVGRCWLMGSAVLRCAVHNAIASPLLAAWFRS